MKGKREAVASLLHGTGLLALAKFLPRKPHLLVFNYHRIGAVEGNDFDDEVFSATADVFRQQVEFLKQHFDLPTLEEIVAATASGFDFTRPTAMITFDDGYRDNYELAFPILKECGVPGVFFIPTGFVNDPKLPWWDKIAYIVKKTEVHTLILDRPSSVRLDLRRMPRPVVASRVLSLFKANAGRDEDEFFEHLEERTEVKIPPGLASHRWIMNWDEIRELASAGMAIGSHTHTHSILAGQDEDTQTRELALSKEILEHQLGGEVSALAYPVGSRGAFTDATKRAARATDYKLAFSYYGGINTSRGFDPFDVHRILVSANDSANLFRLNAVLRSALGLQR